MYQPTSVLSILSTHQLSDDMIDQWSTFDGLKEVGKYREACLFMVITRPTVDEFQYRQRMLTGRDYGQVFTEK